MVRLVTWEYRSYECGHTDSDNALAFSTISVVGVLRDGCVAIAWRRGEFFNTRKDVRGGAVIWWAYGSVSLARQHVGSVQ